MFRNYNELLMGYVDFYKTNLFTEVASSAALYASSASNTLIAGKLNDKLALVLHDNGGCPHQNGTSKSSSRLAAFGSTMEPYKRALEKNLLSLNEYLAGDASSGGDEEGNILPAIGSTLIEEDGRRITIGSFNRLHEADLFYIITLFVAFIMAKKSLSSALKRNKFIDSLGLRSKDRERLDECIWRLMFYLFSSTWLIYTCFVKHNSMFLFAGHTAAFTEYSFTVDLDEYVICLIETTFYLHATYALVFEDVWRRDSPMMLLHHIAAIFSVISAYATRTHKIGLVVMVLRDTCDVLLEVTKLAKCLHFQHGKQKEMAKFCTKFFMSIFTFSFVLNQLYYYPLFCLYHALNMAKVHKLRSATVVGVITCSMIFLLLDLAWFLLILRLLYRMVLKGSLRDLREYDDGETEIKQSVSRSISKKKKSD